MNKTLKAMFQITLFNETDDIVLLNKMSAHLVNKYLPARSRVFGRFYKSILSEQT